jgi:hypothetical protein
LFLFLVCCYNIKMDTNEKINWSALEYEDKERSQDWFWALGIIMTTSVVAAIIFSDYFFAGLLIFSGLFLGFFAIKKPETIYYELNKTGLQIRQRLYPYKKIKSFWVQVGAERNSAIKPLLFIHSERIFMPIITIPIEENMAEEIHSFMLAQNIAEVEMKEHPSEKIMEALGF